MQQIKSILILLFYSSLFYLSVSLFTLSSTPLTHLRPSASPPSPIRALLIHSETCGPCYLLSNTLTDLEAEGRVVLTKAEASENPEICRKFSVDALPVLILDFPDGRQRRVVGNVPRHELESLIAHS